MQISDDGMVRAIRHSMERNRLQQQLQEAEKVRILAETAAAAAHEIFQPLNVVSGKVTLLLEQAAEDDPHRDTYESLRESAERIEDIVRKMAAIEKYAAKPYSGGERIVDFDESAEDTDQAAGRG